MLECSVLNGGSIKLGGPVLYLINKSVGRKLFLLRGVVFCQQAEKFMKSLPKGTVMAKDIRNIQVAPAMVTPMNPNGTVNYEEAARVATYLVDEQAADALVLTGTTGESPTLKAREEYHLYEKVAEAVGDRCIIIAGTGSNSTEEAVERTKRAISLGCVDAILSVAPYYNKPPQKGLIWHFIAVADCGRPTILYNIPGRTSVNLEPSTIEFLSEHELIYGVKECNVDQIPKYKSRVPSHGFQILTGEDGKLIEVLGLGGSGVISVAAHFIGKEMKHAIQMFETDPAGAENLMQKYSTFIDKLFLTTNPIMVKAGLNLLGFNAGGLRLPMIEADHHQITILHSEMKKIGLL